tara:strand:+ start:887 stop:2440 length:1554 start_codon:yes stop_codon:yes gene_type:complete
MSESYSSQFAHQSNYVGVGVTRGLHSSTPAIYSGSASYEKLGTFVDAVGATPSVTIDYDGGSKQYTVTLPDIFIDAGIGIGTVGIRSETQVFINTESTENPNVQVGDVVNFNATGGSLSDQRSRVVGIGTFYFIIEDNIKNVNAASGSCSVTKLETFLPTGIGATGNYRGAICLNDGDNNAGDYDDFIVRCHSANISGSGDSSVVTSYNYENNGAFYGPPVSGDSEQAGDVGYIFNDDGLRGDDADAAGGIGAVSTWKRVKNTFYRYSIPTVSMEYKQVNTNPSSAGQFAFDTSGSDNFIFMNVVDVNGHNNQNFLRNTIGTGSNEGGIAQPNAYNFKITSSVKSNVGIYSSERAYVWGRIINNVNNGNVSSSKIKYEYDIVACNVNLNADGSVPDGVFQDGTNNQSSVIEWFKSDNTSSGNTLTFHGSCDAGNNTAFLVAAQKVQNNTWTHIKRQFAKDQLTAINPPTNSKRFANLDREILPNLDYRVWNFAAGATATTRPYFKIINHPIFDHPDE